MAIGIVRALAGTTTATDSRGITRILRVGDAVELNETVQASNGSTILIQFDNGGFATLGSNDRLVLDQSVVDPAAAAAVVPEDGQNVADIQAMIEAGMDPTQIAEATAAGADAATAGDPEHSGSHSFVVVNQESATAEVTPGLETATFASPLNTAVAQTAEPRFFLNPDAGTGTDSGTPVTPGTPEVPDMPEGPDILDEPAESANSAPAITDRGDGLNLKEAGVGTVEQGGKPGWATGDHNHAIAGTSQAQSSFTVSDADGDSLSARLVDGNGHPVEGAVTDPDTGVMTLETGYGTLTVTPTHNADGSVTYSYGFELNANANSLNENQSVNYDYNIEVSDGRGGTVSENVRVSIEGTNDAPTMKFDSVHVKEAGDGTTGTGGNDGFVGDNHHRFIVEGNLSAKAGDGDANAELTYSVNITGGDRNLETASTGGTAVTDENGNNVSVPVDVLSNTTENGIQTIVTNYGTFILNTVTGEYTFELNTAEGSPANNLAMGEFLNLGFTSTVTDQFGAVGQHIVRVTVEGSNDAPTLSVPETPLDVYQGGPVGEDGSVSVSGTVVGSDADHGAKLTYSFGNDENGNPVTSIETPYGTITIDPQTGEYTCTVNSNAPAFGDLDGKDASLDFMVRVTDEHGAYSEKAVSVNVHGNRPPEMVEQGDGNLNVKESGVIERGENVPNGGWAEGENQTKAPGVMSDGGSFTVKDPDRGDTLKATILDGNGKPLENVQTGDNGVMTVATEYGMLTVTPTVNADGSITYGYQFDLDDSAANRLAQGEHKDVGFHIQVSDSSGAFVTQNVNVRIEGTNDKPDVKGSQVHVKEEGVYNGEETTDDGKSNGNMGGQYHRDVVEGKVPFADPDGNAEVTLSASLSNGKQTVSETTSAVFTGATAGAGQLTGATEKIVVEKTGTYVDQNGHTIQVIDTNYGTLELNTVTGNYSFALNAAAADHLAAGEKFIIDFRVTATDEHGAQGHHDYAVNVTVEGANDAPSFVQLEHNDYPGSEQPGIGVDGKWEVEAAEQGRLHGTDGDTNRVSDHSDVLSGSFVASDRDRGETDTLVFSADFLNGTTSGAHKDSLEKLGSLNPSSVEDLALTQPKVLAEHTDKGTGHYAELPAGTYKVFHFDVGDFYLDVNTGQYYFDVKDGNPMVDGMNPGDSHSLNFSVTVTDEHGASSSHDFTINITGRNDRPELSVSDTPLDVTAGHDATGNLLADHILSVTDDDIGDTHTYHIIANPTMNGQNPGDYDGRKDDFASNKFDNYQPVTQLEGKYGVLTIDPDTGDYTYRLYGKGEGHDDAWQEVQNLGKDAVLDEVFNIGVKDSHNAFDIQEVHISVNGTGIPPAVDPVEGGNLVVNEAGLNNSADGSETAALKLHNGYDIVKGDEGEYREYKGDYGSIKYNESTHQWEYTLDKAYQHAAGGGANVAGDADTVTITVRDDSGRTYEVDVKVDIVDSIPEISVSENGSFVNPEGDRTYQGFLTVDYGADGFSGDMGGRDIQVQVAGSDIPFTFRVDDNGRLMHDSLDILDGTLTLTQGEDGHFDYTFVPAPGHENDRIDIELSVKDHDGDTSIGTIVIDPAAAPSDPSVPENHAPEAGDVLAAVTVDHDTIAINAGGTHGVTDNSAIIVGKVESGSGSIDGVKVDGTGTGLLFEKYVDADLGTVKDSAFRVDSLAEFKQLMASGDAPKVVILGNGEDGFSLESGFKVPEGTILIIDGNINMNNASTLLNEPFGGMLYVTGDLNMPFGTLAVYNQYGSGFMLVEGSLNYEGSIHAVGNLWQTPPHVSTTIDVDSVRVEMDLNKAFSDADGDRMTFAVDGTALPDGYKVSVVDGILTVVGKEGTDFGQHTVTVTATDDKGASTSVSFDIHVTGNHAGVTVSPVDHATAAYDTVMLSETETGAGDVTDTAGHHPLDPMSHTDGLEGMAAAADAIEHGTAGNDVLAASHAHDVLYGDDGHDLMAGDGSVSGLDALAGLVHADAHSESVIHAIQSMNPEELKSLSSALEMSEHHNDGNDLLIGDAGHDVLTGMGGNDILHGGESHDILFGGSGDGLMIGGKGDDVLPGGSGHDTFQYHFGDLDGVAHGGHIPDFHLGNTDPLKGTVDANADVLDIGDLLEGSEAKADGSDLFSGGFLNLEVVKDSVNEEAGTVTVKLTIDQDGTAGHEHGSAALATIEMNGVHGLGGMNPQDQADHLMQQLMDNHSIKL